MAAPTLVGFSQVDVLGSPATSATLSWQTGDVVIVLAGNDGGVNPENIGDPPTTTGSGITFGAAKQLHQSAGTDAAGGVWAAVATANSSGTFSSTNSSGSDHATIAVAIWRGSAGVGNSNISTGSSRTVNLTETGPDGAINWMVLDWHADATQSFTPTSTTHGAGSPGPTATPVSSQVSPFYTIYFAVLDDQTTTGSIAYGIGGSGVGPFTIIAIEAKAGAAAASPPPFNPGKTWRRQFKHPQILPTPPPPAVVVATATPQPIVVTGPTPLPGAVAAVKRATLQDDPVLTTAPPIVETPQPAPRPAGVATVLRGTLQDDPVLTTKPPAVVVGGTPLPAGVSTQVRSSLIDLATPPPLVINPQPARPVPGTLVYSRGTLQDDPVLTTKPPVVTIGQTPLPVGVLAFTARSSLADVVIVTGPTVEPIVNIGQTPYPAGTATVKRATLQDDPVLTTPPPIVVAAPKPQTPAGTSSVYRGSLADTAAATPQPVIVIGAAGTPVTPAPYLSRSSYADVVVAVGTPSPIVVASQAKQAAASPLIILRGSLQDDPQLITKPPLVIAAPIRRLAGLHGVRLIVTPNNTDYVTYIPVPPITVTGSDTTATTVRGVSTAATTAAGVSSPATTAAGVSSPGTTVTGASSPTTTVR